MKNLRMLGVVVAAAFLALLQYRPRRLFIIP